MKGRQSKRLEAPGNGGRAQYLGPARRRPMVLDAALEIFAEGGFADASMEAIARRAGTTKPVLYDCFGGGKQEIYFALLDRESERFLGHMTGVLASTVRMPLEEALRAGLAAFMDYAEINPNGFRVIFGPPGSADAGIVERGEQVREQIVRLMNESTREVQGSTPATPMLRELYVRCIVAVADHVARWWLASKPMERDPLVEAIVQWMMNGFSGILPPEALTRRDRHL